MTGHGMVSPDWKPLVALLETVLDRVMADLAAQRPVCASVTVGHRAAGPDLGLVRVASVGHGGPDLVDAQLDQLGGPVPYAAAGDLPITSPDIWTDPRWPGLTREVMVDRVPGLHAVWASIQGCAVIPTGWDEGGVLALSCCLAEPADDATVAVLARYEPLAAAALAVVHASVTDGPAQVLTMLQSRAVIEQAKGAIMAVARCDAATAWRRLRITSQQLNLKLRDLAVILIEHLGGAPAEQPHGLPTHTPVAPEWLDPAQLWSVLSDPAREIA